MIVWLVFVCVVFFFKDKKEIMEEHQRQLADREVSTVFPLFS